jgi:hypothetical protein
MPNIFSYLVSLFYKLIGIPNTIVNGTPIPDSAITQAGATITEETTPWYYQFVKGIKLFFTVIVIGVLLYLGLKIYKTFKK